MRKTKKQLQEENDALRASLEEARRDQGYDVASDKIVEVSTPTSRTRFHDPSDRVEFEREKYENARQNRKVQALHAVLPNTRGMR